MVSSLKLQTITNETEAVTKSIQAIIKSTNRLSKIILNQKSYFDLPALQSLLLIRNDSIDIKEGEFFYSSNVILIDKYNDFVYAAREDSPNLTWLKSLYIIVLQEIINYQATIIEKV